MDDTVIPPHRAACCHATDVRREVIHDELSDFEAFGFRIVILYNALNFIVRHTAAFYKQCGQNVHIGFFAMS
jgi:hypothetical protein